MRTLTLFILSLFCTTMLYGRENTDTDIIIPKVDTSNIKVKRHSHKPRRNIIELGTTTINYLDGRGTFKNDHWTSAPIKSINFTYTRYIGNKIFLGIERYNFRNYYELNLDADPPPGTLMSRFFSTWSLAGGYSFQKRISNSASVSLNPSFCVAYRYGEGDRLYLAWYPPFSLRVTSSNFKSYGYGPGCSARLTLWDRASLAVQATYEHFDEKYKDYGRSIPPDDEFYDEYKPNRQMLTYHIKLGVAF